MKKQLLILIALIISVIGYSQVFVVNHVTYAVTSTTSNTVRVQTYDVAGGSNVVIPATVDNNSITYSVTSINQMAFINKNISNVDLPSGLTSIGLFAFATNQLSSIVIPDSVTSIGLAAFENNQIISANIPASLTVIEDQVFRNNQLMSITIPDGVTSIGQAAFFGNQLTSITIPSSVTNISSFAFNSNPLTLVTSESTVPPTITTGGSSDTFNANRSSIDLIIPAGSTDPYVNDPGALWTGFNTVNGVSLSTSDFELADAVTVVNTEKELKIISNASARLENYKIYSISGAKIKEGSESTIAIAELSSGIYIIELNFDRGRLAKKFIK